MTCLPKCSSRFLSFFSSHSKVNLFNYSEVHAPVLCEEINDFVLFGKNNSKTNFGFCGAFQIHTFSALFCCSLSHTFHILLNTMQ